MVKRTLDELLEDEDFFAETDENIEIPEPVNTEIQHLPVVLLIDVSTSMAYPENDPPIDRVNKYLQQFFADIEAEKTEAYTRIRDSGDFCVITYGSEAKVELSWTHGSNLTSGIVEDFKPNGATSMYTAIQLAGDMLLERLRGYKREDIDALCGLVFNLTDGEPTDIGEKEKAKKVINFFEYASSSGEAYVKFYHVGAPGFEPESLESLSNKDNRVFDMGNTDLSRFFEFIAATLGSLSGDEDLIVDLADRYLR
ncbi:MAG: VWA domain-containing protein [Lentilitoribacter sp.]